MKRSKGLLVFEVAAFNPKTGEAYIVEDSVSTLHYLVEQGRKHRAKHLGKRFKASSSGRRLLLEDKILETLIWDAEWIHLQIKIKPNFIKLLKGLDALNKEADR